MLPEHEHTNGPINNYLLTNIILLSVSEAVMRTGLADHTVLMFRDVNSGVLNVVYRR